MYYEITWMALLMTPAIYIYYSGNTDKQVNRTDASRCKTSALMKAPTPSDDCSPTFPTSSMVAAERELSTCNEQLKNGAHTHPPMSALQPSKNLPCLSTPRQTSTEKSCRQACQLSRHAWQNQPKRTYYEVQHKLPTTFDTQRITNTNR